MPEAIIFYLSFFSDEKTACAAIGGLLKEDQKWNVVGCEVVCCTGSKCNTQKPTLPYPGSGGEFEGLISCLYVLVVMANNTVTGFIARGLVYFIY